MLLLLYIMTLIVFQNVTSWEVNVCTDFQKDPGDLTVHLLYKDFLFYSLSGRCLKRILVTSQFINRSVN